ncbi:gamma-glutamyltransferase [Pelomyxa schiedti]|nr:gamma-glutamyltransferase [Pelomyxa schiedti]
MSHSCCGGIIGVRPARGECKVCGAARYSSRSPVLSTRGSAASSHPLVSQVALEILRNGGTAVDAAIAANAIQGLVEPMSCGIGGDLFALVSTVPTCNSASRSRTIRGYNASGRSPKSLDYQTLMSLIPSSTSIPPFGPLSVTVPGCVDGWFALHQQFGRLPMSQLLSPAISYATKGFPVSQVIAWQWGNSVEAFKQNRNFLTSNGSHPHATDGFLHTFTRNGIAPQEGEIFTNPDLAHTLEGIATGGRDYFYKTSVPDVVSTWGSQNGVWLKSDDFSTHSGEWVDPVSTNYRGYNIYELPPNTQGLVVLEILNILENCDLAGLGHNSAESIHLMVEAKKLAFADRAAYYGDPLLSKLPVEGLASKSYAKTRMATINTHVAMPSAECGNPHMNHGDTVYITVADENGMMVSLIQSNFREFGSLLVPPGLGFPLQNRGSLFSIGTSDQHPNLYAPCKRPFHTIIPGFVENTEQDFAMSFGVMGADMQPQGHVQVLCNMIDFGMNVQEAGDAVRWCHEGATGGKGILHLEDTMPDHIRDSLTHMGHILSPQGGGRGLFGGYQAIARKGGVYYAASEMRKDGCAVGF